MKINNHEFVVVGLFAGAGGLDTGLMQAGLPVALAIDIDPVACETYRANHPHTVVWNRDICTVTGEEIRTITGNKRIIVAGGSPCQSWSEFKLEIKGSKTGVEDERGRLIYEYLRIVEELQPDVIVFENVPFMVSEQHLPEFQKFRQKLQERTGLILEYKILNALDFGQAQLRERVIMIGTKPNIPNPFQFLKPINGPKTLREALANCPPSEYFHFKKTDAEIMKKIGEGQCWNVLQPHEAYAAMGKDYRGICLDCGHSFIGTNRCPKCQSTNFKNGKGVTSYYRRLSFDKPAYTICAVPTNKAHGMLAHPTEQRCLSIRECARLQGFPDDYVFKGNIFEQQRQIGNAVAVGKARAIGLAIIEALKHAKFNSSEEQPAPVLTAKQTKWLQVIITHPNRHLLSELEKDFIRIAYQRYKAKQAFPPKYDVYLQEIVSKLTKLPKKNIG
jgi:DNA (cytosine-5)-methyltransferase 1